MPGFNGTGPQGFGSMTGGGRGNCALPLTNAGRPSGGRGLRRGLGRGFRNRYWTGNPGMPQEDNVNILKDKIQHLKEELEVLQGQISDLEK